MCPRLASLISQRALATKDESDSDVYFVLKSRGKSAGGRGAPAAADRELAEGYLNLEAMLKAGRDHANLPLTLEASGDRAGGATASINVSVPLASAATAGPHIPTLPTARPLTQLSVLSVLIACMQVSLLSLEPLRRIKFPVAASDAIRIDVGELTASDALMGDGGVVDVWVEVDVLDLDGGTPLRTKPLRKTAQKLDFSYSQTITVDAPKLELLRQALKAPEQESDVYFVLKGRGPRTQERELAQGFVNLQQLSQAAKRGGSADMVRTPIKLVSESRKEYGSLTVSLVASEVLLRATSAATRGVKDAITVAINTLELAPIVRADSTVFEVWAEVDLLGLGDPSPLLTPRMAKGTNASLEMEYRQTVAVPSGSRQQGTLRQALTAKETEAADVYVTLKAAARRGEEKVVGQGALNLRADVLAKKTDLVDLHVKLEASPPPPLIFHSPSPLLASSLPHTPPSFPPALILVLRLAQCAGTQGPGGHAAHGRDRPRGAPRGRLALAARRHRSRRRERGWRGGGGAAHDGSCRGGRALARAAAEVRPRRGRGVDRARPRRHRRQGRAHDDPAAQDDEPARLPLLARAHDRRGLARAGSDAHSHGRGRGAGGRRLL